MRVNVRGGISYNTRHQKWLQNVHNKLKDTPNFMASYLHKKIARNAQLVTQNDYLTNIHNEIIDDNIGVCHGVHTDHKNPKHRPVWIK